MPQSYRRNVEDAKDMLIHAKQKEDETNPVTQVFYHPLQSECLESKENWKLMDIDEEFIQKLEEGERFLFKGSDQEKLVFCTDCETYEVKEGEISNSLVLCPELLYNSDIKNVQGERILKEQKIGGIFNNYLEIRLTFPRLKKLRKLLSCTAYCGPDQDDCAHKGYYFSELLNEIQCSRNELSVSLNTIKAICHDDKWRLLDLEYETRVLSGIISLVEENQSNSINSTELRQVLNSLIPDFVFDHILKHFTTPIDESKGLYCFKEDKVSQSFAEMLLRTAEGKFRYNEFMMAWGQCLPTGMKPDLKHLKGLALVEKEGMQQEVIHLFPEYNLPENVAERFRLLFKRKEKWTLDEITPYIEKLATKSLNVNTMLTKYARASTHNGMRVFGARYAN